jgi:hypothetical protein
MNPSVRWLSALLFWAVASTGVGGGCGSSSGGGVAGSTGTRAGSSGNAGGSSGSGGRGGRGATAGGGGTTGVAGMSGAAGATGTGGATGGTTGGAGASGASGAAGGTQPIGAACVNNGNCSQADGAAVCCLQISTCVLASQCPGGTNYVSCETQPCAKSGWVCCSAGGMHFCTKQSACPAP